MPLMSKITFIEYIAKTPVLSVSDPSPAPFFTVVK
ncbi:hypothetical protein SAOR_10510 [Salinisphaera orenii MK-B5]|uniref:Uncharacterized protein n=1 Tax=Salinisphaera orenii MK-B5 TaxID=856730 RepID=A0A423PLA1_9GAMM|nr:hypothetical protein SAOR_10510 [Salinisphaera orenii MK-B5]